MTGSPGVSARQRHLGGRRCPGAGYSRRVEPSRSGHLPINGLQLYYEAHGELGASGTVPLLLIPGAFLSTDSMKQWVAGFVPERPVIVFDQQGHGRTADTPRPMSYEQFGDDAAAVLHALEVERADVMGYSQGGGVALQLALRHPQLVSKLVALSATASRTRFGIEKVCAQVVCRPLVRGSLAPLVTVTGSRRMRDGSFNRGFSGGVRVPRPDGERQVGIRARRRGAPRRSHVERR